MVCVKPSSEVLVIERTFYDYLNESKRYDRNIFSELYNKKITVTGLRPGEKMLESLINETQSLRIVTDNDGYTYIKPHYYLDSKNEFAIEPRNYNSTLNPLNKEELYKYLNSLNLLKHDSILSL